MAAYQKQKKSILVGEIFHRDYIVGRCMWIGEHYSNEGIFDIANSLLNDDNSPWGRYLL